MLRSGDLICVLFEVASDSPVLVEVDGDVSLPAEFLGFNGMPFCTDELSSFPTTVKVRTFHILGSVLN